MPTILYNDAALLLCVKPSGIPSEGAGSGEEDMTALLRRETGGDIYPVHRLDRGVGGCMVFAKTPAAAAKLSKAVAERQLEKTYFAVVQGVPREPEGVLTDLLFRDAAKNKSYVVTRPRRGVREASLSYVLLGTAETERGTVSLLRVTLQTGRTHQIRVQFASRRMPILFDGKYGAWENRGELALWSCRLAFAHPFRKGKRMTAASRPPEAFPWTLFPPEAFGASS